MLLTINANQKLQNWISIEQELYKLKLNYYKIYNKTKKKIIKNSVHQCIANIVNTTFFFLKPNNNKILIKNDIFYLLDHILFTLIAIKVNKEIIIKGHTLLKK